MLTLRGLTLDDLGLIATWLDQPHVARWWLPGSTISDELADLRESVLGDQPTFALLALEDGQPVGWGQWYRCDAYPDHEAGVAAQPGDVGIDYALGDPAVIGRGLGTMLVAALVGAARASHPGAGVVADPDADNWASRRVLEKNGFILLDLRKVPSEPIDSPMAIYRLPPDLSPTTTVSGSVSAPARLRA